jgi:AcrR family transcriptional regulator
MAVKRLRERQAEATRQQLIDVARQLFTERGYAGTSIEDIIERAGVARGALYHHFPGKDALFAAVYQVVQAEVASAVVAALTADDPAQAVYAGLSAFLDACLEPELGPGRRGPGHPYHRTPIRRQRDHRQPAATQGARPPAPVKRKSATTCRRSATQMPPSGAGRRPGMATWRVPGRARGPWPGTASMPATWPAS